MTYEEARNQIPPGRYRYFKGNEYEVIDIVKHSETEKPMVVYSGHTLCRGKHGVGYVRVELTGEGRALKRRAALVPLQMAGCVDLEPAEAVQCVGLLRKLTESVRADAGRK